MMVYAYGLFKGEQHIYTYSEESVANDLALRLGSDYYVRELSFDEYYKRLKEIYREGKYK